MGVLAPKRLLYYPGHSYTRVVLVSYSYAIMAFISNMYDDDILAAPEHPVVAKAV